MGIKMFPALHLILTLGKWYKTQVFHLAHSTRKHSAFLFCFLLTTSSPRKADVSQPSRNTALVVTCSYTDLQLLCHPAANLAAVPAWAGLTWTGDPCTKYPVPTKAKIQGVPWAQQGCSQQSRLATAPPKLQNPASLLGHWWGHQEGCSSRSASASKQNGLQPLVNCGISNLEDSLSRNLNTAVTTVRSDLFLHVEDTTPTEQTPTTFLLICFTQSSSGHRLGKPVTTLTAATSFHYC